MGPAPPLIVCNLLIARASVPRRCQNASLLFKGSVGFIEGGVVNALLALNTSAVYMRSGNWLNEIVCTVRDFCSPNPAGVPVVNGSVDPVQCTEQLHQTRTTHPTKAYLDTSVLKQTIDKHELKEAVIVDYLRGYWPHLGAVPADDLLASEDSKAPAALNTSTYAWVALLASWDVDPNMDAINEYLQAHDWGTFHGSSQRDAIANYDEVAATLRRLGPRYSSLLT